MATKPSDLLNRIPSVSDLLDKPPVRALADRWNRSVVAAGVRSFLDELRSDFERRTADVHLPSLRELAERAARYVVQLQQPTLRPAINATGRFLDPCWIGLPLADGALERFVALASGFAFNTDYPGQVSAFRAGDVAATLCRLTGAEAATVVHGYTGAIWLTLAAVAADREVVVSRAELGDLEPGCRLASVAASATAMLREVGSVNRTSAADYEVAVTHQTAALLRHAPDGYRVVGETQVAELESLVGLARDRELPLIELLGAAPLVDDLPALGDAMRSVAASIAEGTHLVIARGNGLLGGPRCAIVVGTRGLVHRIETHPMFAAWRVDPLTATALQATLELYGDPNEMRQAIPLYELLSTSVENLRQRAERLAPQLAQAADVEFAEAVSVAADNCLGIAGCADQKLASCGVSLAAADGDVQALEQRLRAAPIPIIGRRQDDRLVLDLRTVLPRQDQRLVDMVVGQSPAKTSDASAPRGGSD